MNIDPYILSFSAITVIVTIWMGFRSAKSSKTASDFFVAGRSVSVGWNASAISGEYLSAASFMGVAGMVMSSGYDALWYPVCYACGYLFLLLFIAGPLRRFGAYTIPDFAEGRFDSPVFRKIAVVFVLFIGFFYTMPQMKGAGTTLAYIFPGLPYWAGVVLVGAVITLNVALGGMKGITLIQAFQYWAKMFAISVPVFVLMAVYGHYGKQVEVNSSKLKFLKGIHVQSVASNNVRIGEKALLTLNGSNQFSTSAVVITNVLSTASGVSEAYFYRIGASPLSSEELIRQFGVELKLVKPMSRVYHDITVGAAIGEIARYGGRETFYHTNLNSNQSLGKLMLRVTSREELVQTMVAALRGQGISVIQDKDSRLFVVADSLTNETLRRLPSQTSTLSKSDAVENGRKQIPEKAPADSIWISPFGPLTTKAAKAAAAAIGKQAASSAQYGDNFEKFELNLNSTTRASEAVKVWELEREAGTDAKSSAASALDEARGFITSGMRTMNFLQAIGSYNAATQRPVYWLRELTNSWRLEPRLFPGFQVRLAKADYVGLLESFMRTNGVGVVSTKEGTLAVRAADTEKVQRTYLAEGMAGVAGALKMAASTAYNTSGADAEKAWLAKHEKPLALLYTYSLIIALVCGTAGLPHILVRFYTNPDGVAAKRTTMWVMILIGIFYVFPPVFGVMGRNLFPELYSGIGAKGTDKIVLELPRILNEKYGVLGSILSGITCAGAFAAFMSTFSGLLVSMTGALAHDVYGRMIRPQSTPTERMRMFKIFAVVVGAVAVVLGMQVEPLQINFMVGQAFAIAAASYFPLLFMSVWWRGMTMKGAATGMLTGGVLALAGISLTSFTDLKWLPLDAFWAAHPLLRILCEQPAIWTVPLAITLMIVVSKLTRKDLPSDLRMKMLVLHAPEKLGLKQEYIQEHQPGGH